MPRRRQTGVRRTPAGTWAVDFRDPLGAKRRKTFGLEREAIEFRDRVRTKIRDGEYIVPVKWTVSQAADKLLEEKADRRPQTVAQLRTHIEKHIKPALGHMAMTSVGFEDIERAGDDWEKEKGLSAEMVNKLYSTIGTIYKLMKRHGVRNNPVTDVKRKRKPAASEQEDGESGKLRPIRTEEVYSAEEIHKLIKASEPGRDRALHMTACLTGLRHGELNGLQWPCVDFKAGKITVRRSLTEISQKNGGPILEPPKTRAGYRDIPIPLELVSDLRKWKLACPPGELDLVFPNESGGPASRKWNERRLKATMERADIKILSMHNLRHTFASQHLLAGTSVTEVAYMMGHSSSEVTMRVYAHWAKSEKSTAASRLAGRIFGAGEGAAAQP